jgi:type I restriction enzyme S subunit
MAQPKLNQKALNSIPIPVCSDELAADLVGKLDELSVETERARAAYERRLQLCTELRESLLHKTFSGQLAGKKAIAA